MVSHLCHLPSTHLASPKRRQNAMRLVGSVRWGHTGSPSARHVLPRGILLELGTIELAQDIGLIVSRAVRLSAYGLPLLVLTLISCFHPKDLIPVSSPTFPCSSSSSSRRHVKLLSYRSPAASIQFGPQRRATLGPLNRWKIRTTQPYQRLGPAIPCNLAEPPNSILSVHDNSAIAGQQV